MFFLQRGLAQDLEMYQRKVYVAKADSLPYRILYPENFDPAKKYPLVMVLHGAGERGNNNESQLVYGATLFLEPQNRQQYPAIVVFPQCPKDSYWSNVNIVTDENGKRSFHYLQKSGEPTKAMKSLLGLLNELEKSGSVDKKQLYIGGLSMGGMGTFELLRRKPKKFAAAFPICGGGHPDGAKKYAKRVPLWVFHGEVDGVVPVEKSEVMVEAVQKAGGNVKFTVYPGVNHNSWDYAFKEPELLPWLFSHKK
ncbi:phospholipase [Pontibacter sp. SGAir0037]|nr:phospholipase [Pontibacter sp. SGAir0037]